MTDSLVHDNSVVAEPSGDPQSHIGLWSAVLKPRIWLFGQRRLDFVVFLSTFGGAWVCVGGLTAGGLCLFYSKWERD